MDAEIDMLHALLNARRKELHSEIYRKANQVSKELSAKQDQQKVCQTQLNSCVEFVESSLQGSTRGDLLPMKEQVLDRLQNIAKVFDPKQIQLGPELVLSVVYGNLSPACQTYGEVHFEQPQFQGTHMKTIFGVEGPCDIAFAATGEIAVCEWHANRVYICL